MSIILKLTLIFYFSLLAWKDYKHKEVSYFDTVIIFIISVSFLKKASPSLTIIYILISLIWAYIEIFYFKNREELFFPMGIVDMFYIIIIFSLIKINFNFSFIYNILFIISSLLTIILALTKNENNKVPYLYAMYPLMLFSLIFY